MRVSQLWRFPVKSMQGEELTSAEVGEHGFAFDRRWAVRDEATGFVLTARREPALLMARAAVVDGLPVITLPSGQVAEDDDTLSAWLGGAVRLVDADGSESGTYETPVDSEDEANSPWVAWTGPAGSFHDSTRTMVSLVSEATIGDWDIRRFRQNVVVDGSGEDELVGNQIAIGDVVLDVKKPVDRCVMVTRPQPGIERDLDVLRTINRERGGNLGIGCLVAGTGTIGVGQAVGVVS